MNNQNHLLLSWKAITKEGLNYNDMKPKDLNSLLIYFKSH